MKKYLCLFGILILISFCCFAKENLNIDLSLKYLAQIPFQKNDLLPVIILLHGYGGDEQNLFELKKYLPSKYLIVSARAPYNLLDRVGYKWYNPSEDNGHKDGNKEQLSKSKDLIIKFIDGIVAKYHANPKEVYLIGFSQGAMMSYFVGLSAPEKVKAIAPLSGMIYPSCKTIISKSAALKSLKIFIAHGINDNVVPYKNGKESFDFLKEIGLMPEFHSYQNMGHTINEQVLGDLINWLK